MHGCRRFRIRKTRARTRTDRSARPRRSSAPQARFMLRSLCRARLLCAGYPSQAAHPRELPPAPAPPTYRHSPPLSPASLDFAVAEIAARQNELDAPRRARCRSASRRRSHPRWRRPRRPPGPDFSSLERHLFKITSQIEALQRPDIEQSIAAFRQELGEIRAAITEAMPRRAIEFDRERDPLAVAPHRREPPERHRRPGACQYRARARRNPRGAAVAEVGRAACRL